MNKTEQIIKQLTDADVSKYSIAKQLGVSWNTVHMWDKGIYEAKPEHFEKLIGIRNAL